MEWGFSRMCRDFSDLSNVAFDHALKLAITGNCNLTILHTESVTADNAWAEFPKVRRTLEQWKLLPPDSPPEAISKLGKAEQQIASCEYCHPADAEIPFDWLLAEVTGNRGPYEFMLSEPARCPNCKQEISEKTLVEPKD